MLKKKSTADPRLPFKTRIVQTSTGPVEVYIIPEEKKEEVLRQLFIYRDVPKLSKVVEDIHVGKKFKVKDYIVAREGGMNVLASPFYFEGGGAVIDWWF
jgi:hypothetical protein